MSTTTPLHSDVQCLTAVKSKEEAHQARLLIESLQTFGADLRDCPFWLFLSDMGIANEFSGLTGITLLPLDIDPAYRYYVLAEKVFACAQAEEMVEANVHSLIWLNLDCLILNPPAMLDLGFAYDVALRPVHIRNIGSLSSEPVDDYWRTIYQKTGIDCIPYTIESFVDGQLIRPYFNTHCFSINPAKGLLKAWRDAFKLLVMDVEFQTGPCQDRLHQIFLHQAIFSALIVKSIDQKRICNLPPEYSYPLHLQSRLPLSRRAHSLNQLACLVYEETTLLDGIDVEEPLKSWLESHR